MDAEIEGELGLKVLHTPAHATIDIVAVHGLGANPRYAWVANVPRNDAKSTDDSITCTRCPPFSFFSKDKRRKKDKFTTVNWLIDLLPNEIPNARIMTFNYASRWHKNAPHQDRYAPSDILLEHLRINREKVGQSGRGLVTMDLKSL